jgi:hypothetical protein
MGELKQTSISLASHRIRGLGSWMLWELDAVGVGCCGSWMLWELDAFLRGLCAYVCITWGEALGFGMDGWMDGWVDGWMGGWIDGFCAQGVYESGVSQVLYVV